MAEDKKFADSVNTSRRKFVLGTAAAAAGITASSDANAGDPFDLLKKLGVPGANQAKAAHDALKQSQAPASTPSSLDDFLKKKSPGTTTSQSSPTIPPSPYPPYEFKTEFTNLLGTADLTTNADRLTASNKPGFTQKAQAAYDDIMSTVAKLKATRDAKGSPGIQRFNANASGLNEQERAQVIGSVISHLRSFAPLRGDSSIANNQDARAIESRTVDGADMVALFIKSVPDAKNVGIKWIATANPDVLREGGETFRTDINQPGTLHEGTMNEFLASAYQDANRNQSSGNAAGSAYRLYDERFRPLALKNIDEEIAKGAGISR